MREEQRFPLVPTKTARGEVALRPYMPLRLAYRGKTVEAAGLLDTGADVNVLLSEPNPEAKTSMPH